MLIAWPGGDGRNREKVIVLAGWFREYLAIDAGKFLTGGPDGDYREGVEGEERNLRGFHGVVRGVMQ